MEVDGNRSASSTAAPAGGGEGLAEGKREPGETSKRGEAQKDAGGPAGDCEGPEGESAAAESENDCLGLAGALQRLSLRNRAEKEDGDEDEKDKEDKEDEGPRHRGKPREPRGQDGMGTRLFSAAACKVRERTKLLVLDINGLLLQRVRGPVPAGVTRRPDMSFRGQKVFQRQHMTPFLEWCLQHFHVAIWSTAKRENVQSLAELVLGANYAQRVAFVWTQTQCTNTGLFHPQERHKPVFLKELRRVWEHPELAPKFNSSNTLLIDDTPYKAALNPPNTAIHPKEWTCDQQDDEMLMPGQPLMTFLQGVAATSHVPRFVCTSKG